TDAMQTSLDRALLWRVQCARSAARRTRENSVALRTARFREWLHREQAHLDYLGAALELEASTIDCSDAATVQSFGHRIIAFYRRSGVLARARKDTGIVLRATSPWVGEPDPRGGGLLHR